MKDLVLVDAQPARIRVFREAIAVYRERLQHLRTRSAEARERARVQLERARETSRALQGAYAVRKTQRKYGDGPGEEVRLHVFPCRDEAMKFLRQEAPYEWAPRPTVVFTDVYLDDRSRPSMVEEMKADADLRQIPTVTLCSGATVAEIRDAWESGSNAVVDLSGDAPAMLIQVADTLEFWLQEAAL